MLTMHPSSLLFLCVVVKSLVIVTLRHCDPVTPAWPHGGDY